MQYFATEEMVRLKFFLDTVEGLSSELIQASIAQAHGDIAGRIREALLDEPPGPVVVAETLHAGAAVLRALAARAALERREARLAGHQLETGKQFPALITAATAAEREAERLLAPWLRHGAFPETPVLLTEGETP